MTRRAKAEQASGYTVLLVDDNPDYLQATRLLLEREGHNVLTATNGPEALSVLPQQKVDLLLLDYFMPGMTGEQVVAEIRKFDPYVQVILQTGYASEQPPRELLHRLNIQGYYDKTEGPEQLLLWTTVGLKAAFTIQLLFKSRHGVEFILDKTPDLHRMQSIDELSQLVMQLLSSLFASVGAGSDAAGFLAMLDSNSELVLRAGTGPYATKGKARDVIDAEKMALIDLALQEAEVQISPKGTIYRFVSDRSRWVSSASIKSWWSIRRSSWHACSPTRPRLLSRTRSSTSLPPSTCSLEPTFPAFSSRRSSASSRPVYAVAKWWRCSWSTSTK